MKQKLLIAHAKGEEAIAEKIAIKLRDAGYEPVHMGTIFVGESLVEEASKLLSEKAPVLLCATFKAVATKWPRQLVNASRQHAGVKVFAMQMDEEIYMDQLTLDEKYVKYWEDETKAINELLDALEKYYPINGEAHSNVILEASISNYYAELKKRYQRLDLDSLTPRQRMDYLEVQLQSVYVEQNVRDNPPPVFLPGEIRERLENNHEFAQEELPEDISLEDVKRVSDVYYRKQPRPVLDILSEIVNQHIVVLGDPGSGKSTLTRYIVLSMIDKDQGSKIATTFPEYLPLLIELKSYIALLKKDDSYRNFLDYFEYIKSTEGYYIEKKILHEYLQKNGKAIIIFDGLDEIFEPNERDQICRHIDNFKATYPAVRIIVTSRVVGFRRKILSDTGFKIYTLQDLEEHQIREFIGKWYAIALFDKPELAIERSNLIMGAISDSPSIRQLAGNPLLLTIMAILAKNQELPRERWKLYDHASRVLIEIWDVNKYLQDNELKAEHIDEDDKREMLQRIALKMQVGKDVSAGNYITEKELQREFENYIVERYQEQRGGAKVTSDNMILQLRERNFILSLYGAKLYGFVHRAFLEYFCALSFLHDFKNTQRLSLEQLKIEVFGKYWNDQSWHEVLRLLSGMIEPSFADEIIYFLSWEIKPLLGAMNTKMDAPLNQSLAIKCLGEIKKIHLLSRSSKALLERICYAFDSDMELAPVFFSFFKQHILPIAKSIGNTWPENDYLADILVNRQGPNYSYIYDNLFGSFIGYIGKGSDKVYKALLGYAENPDPKIRVTVPFALATGWNENPQTYNLLCGLADNDSHRTVCYAAIYALAEHYHNREETFILLRRNAEYSPHEFGRAAAITGLADHYFGNEGVFELIKELSQKEPAKFPRTVAIKALGEYFMDLPGTYELLCKAAINDESPKPDDKEYADPYYVRDAALDAIYRNWPEKEDTVTLLRDRSKNDQTTWLRQKAKAMLEKLNQF